MKKRDIEDFTYGLVVPSKLMPRTIKGGVVLQETKFEMRWLYEIYRWTIKKYISSLTERLKQENFNFNIQLKYDKEFDEFCIVVFINSYSKDTGYNIFNIIPLTNVDDAVEVIKKLNQGVY